VLQLLSSTTHHKSTHLKCYERRSASWETIFLDTKRLVTENEDVFGHLPEMTNEVAGRLMEEYKMAASNRLDNRNHQAVLNLPPLAGTSRKSTVKTASKKRRSSPLSTASKKRRSSPSPEALDKSRTVPQAGSAYTISIESSSPSPLHSHSSSHRHISGSTSSKRPRTTSETRSSSPDGLLSSSTAQSQAKKRRITVIVLQNR
jgi:hypothetical protein